MSALAGIFKFDPRDHMGRNELTKLACEINRIGPDGGRELLDQGLGMAYRAFHTTGESHLESQPLVRRGCILTWDGRLDNREEIRSRVDQEFGETTDIDLVFAAYEKWGTSGFAELVGDWAIALWDQPRQRLMLARDAMGVRRLFYRLDPDGVAWCTTIEPLVLTSPGKMHLDLDYLAGCLYPRPPVETTPYREIRSVVPGSFLTFKFGGDQSTRQYWSLNPHARIRCARDSEYDDHFRSLFRDAVRHRLRADRTVLAELSGGIDSSAIVCMADEIRNRESGPSVETLSYFDIDEPSGDERPYFTLIEQRRGRIGHHISLSDFNREFGAEVWMPLPDGSFSAVPGYSARSLRWASAIDEIQSRIGARVILSGVGGDEMLGGVQYEAPELADYLLAGKLISFLRATLRWGVDRKKTVFRLLAETLDLVLASRCPESLLADTSEPFSWAVLRPQQRHAAFDSFSRWKELSPVLLSIEFVRYVLAQQLTCMDPPLVGCQERRYPFLDRALFVFLASIPRTQLLQAGHRRHLMRRALQGLVPDEVLFRKTKWFGFRSPVADLNRDQRTLDALFENRWLTDGLVVDASMLQKHLVAVQHGSLGEAMALRSAIGIEHWLRTQIRYGTLEFKSSSTKRAAVHERA